MLRWKYSNAEIHETEKSLPHFFFFYTNKEKNIKNISMNVTSLLYINEGILGSTFQHHGQRQGVWNVKHWINNKSSLICYT